MFEQTTYEAWLERRSEEIFDKLTHEKPLEPDETLVLVLKAQSDNLRRVEQQMKERFDQVDKRFDQVDKRFDQVERRMDRMESFMRWSLGLTIGVLGLLMTLFQFLG